MQERKEPFDGEDLDKSLMPRCKSQQVRSTTQLLDSSTGPADCFGLPHVPDYISAYNLCLLGPCRPVTRILGYQQNSQLQLGQPVP